eukprot:SAG31_NODE_12558_length_932_cov_1.774310_1_plen_145_part_00
MAASDTAAPLLAAPAPPITDLEDESFDDIPTYWFWVISLYNIPLGIANTVINSILLPPLIQRVVGAEGKEAALGLVVSMVSLIHTVEPFLGALSDRARCGGQGCTCLGIAGMWFVEHLPEWHLLVGAYFVFHLGNMVGWVPCEC